MRSLITALTLIVLMFSTAFAQRGGGDESGGRASRGGFGGGGFGGGGFPGGAGGTRGGFPGGGFPGGGFPGGGFPGGGFPGGGDRGSRGGGFPGAPTGGGDRGGRGGSPGGGFNPADMVRRFDSNGNNMIDPSEAQGPAQFFLQRMAQNNPKIDLTKPVPIDLLTGEIEKMRGGGGDSGSPASDEPQLLVPDFSLSVVPQPVAGFAAEGSLYSVKIEERDIKEAEERLRRYDSNKDGVLSGDELRAGRWGDDPMQFDRNRDGKLSASELAVRYANRRVTEEEQRATASQQRSRGGWGGAPATGGWTRGDSTDDKQEEQSRFGDAKSYRMASADQKLNSIKGLPDFFARSDADGDGQVMMSEFSTAWSTEKLEEYFKWDLNSDGVITARECLAALEGGARVSSSGDSAPASNSASTASGGSSSSGGGGSVEYEWAQRQISKYDKNGDKQLTASEWDAMIIKPDGADSNGDGVITVDEYAAFRAKK
ncbi:MAG: EF-hand domain-containing protein [Pirellulaceae bacterium]